VLQRWEAGPPVRGKIAEAVRAILDALSKLEVEGVDDISVKALRALAGLQDRPTRTLTEAVKRVAQEGNWERQGRSLVRVTAKTSGFGEAE
jgi:hypothetical protein